MQKLCETVHVSHLLRAPKIDVPMQSSVLKLSLKPEQPDFSTLDLGFDAKQSEFPMPSDTRGGEKKSFVSMKLDNFRLNQYLEDQLLQIDEICHVFGKKRKNEQAKTSEDLLESWHEADHACDLAKLASEACALWEETKPSYDTQLSSQLSSCCTSMCSTVVAASSTVVSVSFTASMSMSFPPDAGSFSHFDLSHRAKTIADAASGLHADKRKRTDTYGSDAALAAACSLLIHSNAAPGANSAQSASKPHHSVAHRPAATRPSQRPHDVEEFSVGSGWPGL